MLVWSVLGVELTACRELLQRSIWNLRADAHASKFSCRSYSCTKLSVESEKNTLQTIPISTEVLVWHFTQTAYCSTSFLPLYSALNSKNPREKNERLPRSQRGKKKPLCECECARSVDLPAPMCVSCQVCKAKLQAMVLSSVDEFPLGLSLHLAGNYVC